MRVSSMSSIDSIVHHGIMVHGCLQAPNNEGKGPQFFISLNCRPRQLFIDMCSRHQQGFCAYQGENVQVEAPPTANLFAGCLRRWQLAHDMHVTP